jgi:hypothetical protein
VSVCFERGGKIASSRTQKMQLMNDGTVEINFEEALSLVVTMYREDSGKYQVIDLFLSLLICDIGKDWSHRDPTKIQKSLGWRNV